MALKSRKYCTYRSGVNVFSMTAFSSPTLANVCGAPVGTMTQVPGPASYWSSPTVNLNVPAST
jgi:hypothetical protein